MTLVQACSRAEPNHPWAPVHGSDCSGLASGKVGQGGARSINGRQERWLRSAVVRRTGWSGGASFPVPAQHKLGQIYWERKRPKRQTNREGAPLPVYPPFAARSLSKGQDLAARGCAVSAVKQATAGGARLSRAAPPLWPVRCDMVEPACRERRNKAVLPTSRPRRERRPRSSVRRSSTG